MTKVKICGITGLEDARLALSLGAAELGFVFAPSPRRVEPTAVREIMATLRADRELAALRRASGVGGFRAIGVFVNETAARMRAILKEVGLDAAQIHGDERPEACADFDFPWYRALRPAAVGEVRDLVNLGWNCPRILADAAARGVYGGTGSTLSLDVAVAARDAVRRAGKEFFLAGGIGPANVARTILETEPDGIDLSSGVERAPGSKSAALLRELFSEIGRADRELEARKEAADAAR